jgi:predicted TIM-barrel fold metal-dependent hydrolase
MFGSRWPIVSAKGCYQQDRSDLAAALPRTVRDLVEARVTVLVHNSDSYDAKRKARWISAGNVSL